MSNSISNASLQRTAKAAGIAFLFMPTGGILYGIFVMFKLSDPNSVIQTGKNILANPALLRLGILYEVVMAAAIMILGTTLYTLLKKVNKTVALTALVFKIGEAALASAIAFISFLGLQMLSGNGIESGNAKFVTMLLGTILRSHTVLYALPMFLLGLSLPLFFYLLRKSGLVPRRLACFGVFSYVLIFAYSVLTIMTPQVMKVVPEILFWAPSILFEFLIGFWLLIKGVHINGDMA